MNDNDKSDNADICIWNENELRFIQCEGFEGLTHAIPPYLLSFQGSGNTFTRLVIELVTGYWTGNALWNDKPLIQAGFKGDGYCNDQTITIKAHVKCSEYLILT